MGRIEIWFEPVLGKNREIFVSHCQDALRAGHDRTFLYLVATRPLWEDVVRRIVDGERVTACGELRVFLFDGFVRRFLQEGRQTPLFLEEGERGVIVERLLAELNARGMLRHVREIAHLPGCARSIARLLGELQRADMSAEDFAEFASRTALTDARDHDVATIYTAYARVLNDIVALDPDGAYRSVLEIFRRRPDLPPWLRETRVLLIEGFFDFTPVQKTLLRYLIERIPKTMVSLVFDPENPSVFQEPLAATLQFFHSFGERAITLQRTETLSYDVRLRPLRRLFADTGGTGERGERIVEGEPPITIIAAMGFAEEVREIARLIKRLVHDEGYRTSEIAVIARDVAYLRALGEELPRLGIPIALDVREPLTAVPIVKAALRVLEARVERERAAAYAALLKSDYLRSFSSYDRDALESAMRAVGVDLNIHEFRKRARDLRRIKEHQAQTLTARTVDLEEVQQELARLRRAEAALEATLEAVDGMQRALAHIPERGQVPDFVEGFRRALDAFGLRDQVQRELLEAGRDEEAWRRIARDLRGWQALEECLDRLVHLCERADRAIAAHGIQGAREDKTTITAATVFQRPLDVREFRDLFVHWIEQVEFRRERGDPAGVRLLEATQARGLAFRVVILPGLIEGGFPRAPEHDWIYSMAERERLAAAGLFLEDLSPRRFEAKEAHFFYHAVGQATERVYLTYPRAEATGEDTVPSPFLEEVREVYGEGEGGISAIPIREIDPTTYDVRAIASLDDGRRALLASVYQTTPDDALVLHLYNEALRAGWVDQSLLHRAAIERRREAGEPGPFTGVLTDAVVRQHLRGRFGPRRIYSPSQLNTYGQCPFRFFAQRVLRLEKREEASLDLVALDRGYLLHVILHEFFERHGRGSLAPERRYEYREEMARVAERIFSEYEQKALPINRALWELEKAELLDTLIQFLDAEIAYQQRTGGRMRPYWLELGFGIEPQDRDRCHPDSRREPLVLRRAKSSSEHGRAIVEEDRLQIRGRIDRVDRSDEGHYIAYDYKSGSGASAEEIEEGVDLQLPLYILALERLFLRPGEEVVGGGYYSIRTGKRTRGLYRREAVELTAISERARSSLPTPEWRERLVRAEHFAWQYVEGMRRGDFRVQPRSTRVCQHCEFQAVCRFDPYRAHFAVNEGSSAFEERE
ncbi:MAG: PD-(D/E)XK nuclease family protein [Blastocatellia bacterium]|nr:PD-(D/E)XK nuclease family protein [Blastocatellia bacterium]MCX7752732.1 PD-(D/E)XK nuclease family protein [Blastocatellia bacterium]MDW8256811.1 PD-(D/E)XK nuclease family protein [Acidobacteriota bacterium]